MINATLNISKRILNSMYFEPRNFEYQALYYEDYRYSKREDQSYMTVPVEIILVASFIFISMPVKKCMKLHSKFAAHIDPKLFIILLAIPFGILSSYQIEVANFTNNIKIFPGYYYNIIVPSIIFYVSYETDYHILFRCWHQILIIGVLRYILDATLVGLIMSRVIISDWIFAEHLLFGFAITPIAPFGNTDNMKRLSKFKHIGCLLDNEALLGYIISHMVIKNSILYVTEKTDSIGSTVLLILKDAVCGFLFGVVTGRIGCFIMKYFRNNSVNAVLLTGALTLFAYNICEKFFSISGPLAVMMIGLFFGYDRRKYTSNVNKYIGKFWSAVFYLCEQWLLFTMSAITIERMILYKPKNIHMMIITYLVTGVIRLATFLLFTPILSRLGYGLNIRCILALSMAANKDVINMLYAHQLLYYGKTFHLGTKSISHVYISVLLSHLLNNSRLDSSLKLLGLTEVSLARKTNMDNCMRHIMEKRNIYLALLKTNRYLSDANWSVVDAGTFLKHPYGNPVSRDDNEDDWSNRKAQCPDCERIFFVELTDKEKVYVKREIFQRILKTQTISFIRQLGEGMLSRDAITILLQAIEVAEDSPDCNINIQELFKPFHKKSPMHFLKRCLTTHGNKRREVIHTPRRAYRRFLYNIVTSMYFEIGIYIFILLSCVSVMYDMAVDLEQTSVEMYWINISYIFVFIMYWLEFIIKILAYSWVFISDGFRNYFRSVWNDIDFAIIIISSIDVFLVAIHYFVYGYTDYVPDKYFLIVKAIRLFRVIRLLTIFRGTVPKILKYVDGRIEVKLALGYDVGKGLIVSYEDVTNALEQIVGNVTLQNEVKATIEKLNQEVMKELMQVIKDRPWLAIAVKTKQCIRSVLKHLSDGIKYLQRTGNVDDLEFASINSIIERNNKRLNYLKQIPPASPKELFNEILWLNCNNQIIDFLFNYAEVITFEKEETIFEEGQKADGVYLVIEGMAHLAHDSRSDSDYSSMQLGMLPIIDYISKLRFDEKIYEIILRGNTFGELSVLTGRPYSCTIYTDASSPCKCYYISLNIIHEGFRTFDDPVYGLKSQMWKYATLQLSLAVLQEIPIYQLMSINEIKTHLVKSFVADLSNFHNFIFVDLIEDLILLDGKIMDETTNIVYVAPSYIPRSVRRLVNPDQEEQGLQCILLIIPMEGVYEYDIMEKIEEYSTMIDIFASNIITGSEAARISRRQRKKSNKFNNRSTMQKNVFGGLRSNLQEIKLFDEAVLLLQLQETAQERKTSVFFTQATAMKNVQTPDD